VAPGAAWASLKADGPASVAALEGWAADAFRRWTGSEGLPLRFTLGAAVVVDVPPPLLPAAEEGWWSRLQGTRRFLGYFRGRRDRFPAPAGDGSRIYLYIEPRTEFFPHEAADSVGTRRGRIGIVKASDDPAEWGNTLAVILHETLHTVGALDHRNRDGFARYPDGYAEPERTPFHPQAKAEVMALGIPIADREELRVSLLAEVVMGEATAREIGWLAPGE
jgi:hypothetical protein